MRKLYFWCLTTILFVACGEKLQEDSIDWDEFQNPSSEYRASLFYSLNDSLYPEIIRKQIIEFAEGGIGRVFFHAREGLLTQYFEKDWWKAIDAGVDQCVKSGIIPWFYDEYKWPSGYAGGFVPRKSENFRGHSLIRLSKEDPVPRGGVLVSSDGQYNYICMTASLGNSWLNGACKIDYLNPQAIEAFIEHTYKTYAQRNKNLYNGTVKGIFFDEPDILPSTGREYDVIGYSPEFRETFYEVKGYDIAKHFESLFEEKGNYRKIRLDYWQIMGLQYEKAFVGQLGDFCRANNLALTGHFFPEETLGGCQAGIGNLMRQLRNEDLPGMDHLELRVEGGLNVAKSISSIGNQYGKKRRMSELFGVSGQNMSFEDQKWIANWHAVLGINFFVEHLALYSMRGERKRDYPPTLSYQQPWWKNNKCIQDYIGRLCYLSTVGKYAAETLLLVPLESMYIAVKDEREKLEKEYYTTMENLMKVHCDFDLGDEQILSEIGHVDDGYLQLGEMKYNTVIIPSSLTLRVTTVQLLLDFAKKGGRILVMDDYPCYVDAEENVDLLSQLRQFSLLLSNTADSLRENVDVLHVKNDEDAEIYTQKRITDIGNMYMLTNISRKNTERVIFTLGKHEVNPVIWDLFTAKTYTAKADGNGEITLELPPAGLLVLTTGGLSDAAPVSPEYKLSERCHTLFALEGKWKGKKVAPNVLTLDFARYSVNGLKLSQPEPLIAIMKCMAEKKEDLPLHLQFNFTVEDIPASCALVVEHPEMYSDICINGQRIAGFGEAYYYDVFFKKSNDIASLLQEGNNTIDITMDFIAPIPTDTIFAHRYGTELESIYLIGDFALRPDMRLLNQWNTEKNATGTFVEKPVHLLNQFVMVKEPLEFDGDISYEGFPFYAGTFVLSNTFTLSKKEKGKSYYIYLPLSESIVYELEINGYPLEARVASPYVWDVTSFVVEGENEIRFSLTNSLRNLLGPHHHKGGELKGTSALSFTGAGGWPNGTGDSDWINLRLDKKNKLRVWTDDYNIIPFGFIEPVQLLVGNKTEN